MQDICTDMIVELLIVHYNIVRDWTVVRRAKRATTFGGPGAFAPPAPRLTQHSQYMQHASTITCKKHISDVEATGHDQVEETMGYEHTA